MSLLFRISSPAGKGTSSSGRSLPGVLWLLFVLLFASGRLKADNRVQTENALPGTRFWPLSNPISAGWPTNQEATTPEIEGYASATSVNTNESLTLFVDVRIPNVAPTYSLEIFRMGYYSGLGARQMSWLVDGESVNRVELPSVKQVIPSPDPTTGRVECNWTPSYVFTVPETWVSGIYLAKLTALPLGKQSYIIFVVREDDRSSDLLFQSSVTTFQAYNPWGGRSLYGYPTAPATEVSFLRPYSCAAYPFGLKSNPPRADLLMGAGAGEFFTTIGSDPRPGWEYNMVRWLERQGFDVTYATSVDTHRQADLRWPGKEVKTFLSVGHDEYWSPEMRAHVTAARDRGVNLGIFAGNVCYWRIHFNSAATRFSCRKSEPLQYDQWRSVWVKEPEISLLGVQYIFNTVDLDLRLPNPLPAHWIYDYSRVVPGELLPGLLGYEIDGEWDTYPTLSDTTRPVSLPGTVRLASTPFHKPGSPPGTSYATYYEAPSGAKVFASGSMQWNWGLDDYNAQQLPGQVSRVNRKAQQMTYNLLTRFGDAQAATRPLSFVGADALTRGNWDNAYGVEGYAVADGTEPDQVLRNPVATVRLSGHSAKLWNPEIADLRSLRISRGADERIIGAWISTSELVIDVGITDGSEHQFALYCVDWESAGVTQRIELYDPAAPEVILDRRDLRIPATGVYLVWTLEGHRAFRITNTSEQAGSYASVSGLFLGGDGLVRFLGADVGTATSGTRGDWISSSGDKKYGREGYNIAFDRSSLPPFATLEFNGASPSLSAIGPLDSRSLRRVDEQGKPTGNRIAASWNSGQPSFSLDLKLLDDRPHQVSLFFSDWDGCSGTFGPRRESVGVSTRNNGRILDQRELPSTGFDFCNGTYLTWLVQGNVRFRVTSLLPSVRPVMSALFLDPAGRPSVEITRLPSTPGTCRLRIRWDSIPGETYRIEYSPELLHPDWSVLVDNQQATGESEDRAVEAPENSTGGFYRVVLVR